MQAIIVITEHSYPAPPCIMLTEYWFVKRRHA